MAQYFHDGRTVTYAIDAAPFAHDLLLLHSSSAQGLDFWRPVRESLAQSPREQGRILVCDWYEKGRAPEQLAEDVRQLLLTLGMNEVRVVACGDAVEVVTAMARQNAATFTDRLLFPHQIPPDPELTNAIRDFSQI